MSSYRGAWDGGPPGAEGEYVPGAAPLPATDPWTGASYGQYGATGYDYGAYGAAAYPYGYDPRYYQQQAEYYAKYPTSGLYSAPAPPTGGPERGRARSSRSQSRSASPYKARGRSYSRSRGDSDNEARRCRSRSSSHRNKYSSSDRSSSRPRSYSPVKKDKKKKRRSASSDSSESKTSYKKTVSSGRRNDHSVSPSPKLKKYKSRKRSDTPGTPDSNKSVTKSKDAKGHSSKESKNKTKKRRDVVTPPRKRKPSSSPKGWRPCSVSPPRSYKKSDRDRSLTPPKSYQYKEHSSETTLRKARESSITPPKSYARNSSISSKSGSESPVRRRKKTRGRRSSQSSSPSSDSSDSSHRLRSKKRKAKRKSASRHRSDSKSSRRRSRSRSRRRSKSKTSKRSMTPEENSRGQRSASGTPSDNEQRRGQFTVSDRKRYWKMHRSRQEERSKEARTPPKEVKPPPGAVESTRVDDIEYGDPPDVEGPNFAELLPPPDLVALATASTSKSSKGVPIPIKNDGSFLEMFKKMQEVTKKIEEEKKPEMKKPTLPFIGKRRGGRVLKTGLVKKAKAIDEQTVDNTPKDAWSLYMQEVKKYRETSCEEERKTRPLVK